MPEKIDIEEIRLWGRWTHEQFARKLGISTTTLWRWRKRGVPAGPGRQLLEHLRNEMNAERRRRLEEPWSAL